MQQFVEFASRHQFLAIATVLLVAALLVTETQRALRRWRELGSFELTQRVNAGALLIDLRDAAAYAAGHIVGARHAEPAALDAAVATHSKDAALVVYCETGVESGRAATRLAAAGFTNAATLRGGLATWRAENLPLARG